MFWFSTDAFAADHTEGFLRHLLSGLALHVADAPYALLHFAIRKGAHLTGYAILALLLLRAVQGGGAAAWQWRRVALTVLLVTIHALLDEYHQSFTQSRSASLADSALDVAGGLAALAFLWLRRRWRPPQDRARQEGAQGKPIYSAKGKVA